MPWGSMGSATAVRTRSDATRARVVDVCLPHSVGRDQAALVGVGQEREVGELKLLAAANVGRDGEPRRA